MKRHDDLVFTDREQELIADSSSQEKNRRLIRVILWAALFATALLYVAAFHVGPRWVVFVVAMSFIFGTMVERIAAGYQVLHYKQLVMKLTRTLEEAREAEPSEDESP